MNRRTIDAIERAVTVPMLLDFHGIKHGPRRCNCPVHNSTRRDTFSFNDKFFHCFACGVGGGVIQLEQNLSGTSGDVACKAIAKAFGIDIADGPLTDEERAESKLNRRIGESYDEWEREKHDYYCVMSDLYRHISVRLQDGNDALLLEMQKSLEEWLDDNLEGVVTPWIFQSTQAKTSLTEQNHTSSY